MTAKPVTAGELRFIFGVVQPNPWGGGSEATCGRKQFTTIFEYGVPITGCTNVVDWAKQWTALQAFPGFTAGYLAQLQSMTESVVLHGAAPAKGNQNAIDQIRTNEIALGGQWELREFTLTDEKPAADLPSNGELRTHTVAQTPNDARSADRRRRPGRQQLRARPRHRRPRAAGLAAEPLQLFFHRAVLRRRDAFPRRKRAGRAARFLAGEQRARDRCRDLRAPSVLDEHLPGCHHADTGTNGLGGSTNFVHVEPSSSIPVTMSKFLTGGARA